VRRALDLLIAEMDEAYRTVRDRVQGLGDEEFFWEPASGCWTVYRGADGRWTYHYELPEPTPSPLTTIAWRLNHIAGCKVMYHEYAFGSAELTWDTIEVPSSAAAAVSMLARGQQLLEQDVASLDTDNDLDEPRRTNWGELWPAWKIFWTMIRHDAHHGGEIGALRDLYRQRN
jgi:hypothetical protein